MNPYHHLYIYVYIGIYLVYISILEPHSRFDDKLTLIPGNIFLKTGVRFEKCSGNRTFYGCTAGLASRTKYPLQCGPAVTKRQFGVQARSLISCALTNNICDMSYMIIIFSAPNEPFSAFLAYYYMHRENHISR